jgi:ATP:cob(I)alamin adenosyltransferase
VAKIYTKIGDKGTTRLGNNSVVPKDHKRIAVSGIIDEASSALGLARSYLSSELKKDILSLQADFVNLMGRICLYNPDAKIMQVTEIEKKIDNIKEKTPIESVFVYPGNSTGGAALHMARSIMRRAERQYVSLSHDDEINPEDLKYINRVSDYLYVMAVYADYEEHVVEIARATVEEIQNREGAMCPVKDDEISLEEAKSLICVMEKKSLEMKIAMVLAVVDDHGSLVAFLRQDGALPISTKLAPAKAYTSVQLKMPTKQLTGLIQPENELFGININDPNLVVFGGGIPLTKNGRIVGAIGVSGGSVEQDVTVAEEALAFWNK